MRLRVRVVVFLCGLWPLVATAAPEPLPLEPTVPDLTGFLQIQFPSSEKPEIALPDLEAIIPPVGAPQLPSQPLAPDLGFKPQATAPEPGVLPCNPIGTVLGVPTQLLDCGRVRFSRGEYDDARRALESAIGGSQDQFLITEARYWLGESYLRLGRLDLAQDNFRLVVQSDPKSEVGNYGRYDLGWIHLRLSRPAEALGEFDGLLKERLITDLGPHVRHGRALALYGLGRFAEARDEWRSLSSSRLPPWLQQELLFWLGEATGRAGEPAEAVEIFNRFTSSALQSPRLDAGILRMGWWALEAGQPLEAAKSFRWLLSAFPKTAELPWARYGFVRASLQLGDLSTAREEARELRSVFPSHSLVITSLIDLGSSALAREAYEEANSFFQELLSLSPPPSVREYILFLSAEALRRQARLGEAKAQYEAARSLSGGTVSAQSGYRLAQVAFFQREYGRARAEAEQLLAGSPPDQLKASALLVVGEASYWGREYEAARSASERFLREFPQRPEAPLALLSLGWSEFRLGKTSQAREHWLAFASDHPSHPEAPNALLMAAELQVRGGSPEGARALLDRLINQAPSARQVEVALFNRALLLLKGGEPREGAAELRDLLLRSPMMANVENVHLAYGTALLRTGESAPAVTEFQIALRGHEEPLGNLGLGWAALSSGQRELALNAFQRSRSSSDSEFRQLSDYGIAAVHFKSGQLAEFKKLAQAFLRVAPRHSAAPTLLYLLTGAAIEAKEWGEAGTLALRLAGDYRESAPADDALFRVGEAAEQAGESKVSREAYRALLDRFRQSPFLESARLALGLSLAKGGEAASAKPILSEFVAANPKDPRLPEALMALGKTQESAGDQASAKLFYGRLIQEFPQNPLSIEARVGQGRILLQEGRWDEGRQMLEGALEAGEGQIAGAAAFTLGEGYRKGGKLDDAVEAYMTAAYIAPDSSLGQRALLNAGDALQALKRPESAITIYRKLVNRPNVDPELAKAARQALEKLSGPQSKVR